MAHGDATDRISEAKTKLLLKAPFFGRLCMQLEFVESELNSTAWTDGKYLGYYAPYVMTLTGKQLQCLIAEEVLHCALMHFKRKEGRDWRIWNLACDCVINLLLKDDGYELDDICFYKEEYRGMDAEEIYVRLMKNKDAHKDRKSKGEVMPSGTGTPVGEPTEPESTTEAKWEVATTNAVQAMTDGGKGRDSSSVDAVRRNVLKIIRPEHSVTAYMRDFVEHVARNEYNWGRVNPRYVMHGAILPSLAGSELGPFVVVFDTSGSIPERAIAEMGGDLADILDTYDTECDVLYVDRQVRNTQHFISGDEIALDPKGGGGTDFRPAFKWVEENGVQPACLLYFTDLWGRFPDDEPDYPVLWCVKGNNDTDEEAPFGGTVRVSKWSSSREAAA